MYLRSVQGYGNYPDLFIPGPSGTRRGAKNLSNRAGLIIEYRDYKIGDRRDNPYLQSDSITGSNGGAVSGIGMVYVWDNRDQVFFPNNGGITEVKIIFYTKDVGSDFTFHWLEINSRRYWAFVVRSCAFASIPYSPIPLRMKCLYCHVIFVMPECHAELACP